MKKESTNKELFQTRESYWNNLSTKQQKEVFEFSEKYKKFLSENKTERLCAINIVKTLQSQKFKNISTMKQLKEGDKVYKLFKEKVVIAAIVGKDKTWNLIGSHTDSPRIDLKPNPIYEEADLVLFKSHYYGGIKKYQWVNTPLAMHGIVYTKKGEKIEIHLGETENEPKFIISDLLPHLAKDQMDKPAIKVIDGEQMNIILGNIPLEDKDVKEKFKLNILKILEKNYKISEEDFNFAEFEFVPAGKAMDVGLDCSMVGSYGQDDRVCVYTSLQALTEAKKVNKTAIGFFVDKEEIGSTGDTGAQSFALLNFAQEYIEKTGLKIQTGELFENSKAISADVTSAFDPAYKEVFDKYNVSYLGRGVSIEKYGGGGGKYSTHDSGAEYMSYLRSILIKHKLPYQMGEIGKVDIGGGGTIAMFMSRYGMDCVDAGPCVLGMHSPCEVTSKADIYSAYLFYKAFFED
ncbi:MAG: aminopeptidase [Candidatus Woesearchaeota archaeon]